MQGRELKKGGSEGGRGRRVRNGGGLTSALIKKVSNGQLRYYLARRNIMKRAEKTTTTMLIKSVSPSSQ